MKTKTSPRRRRLTPQERFDRVSHQLDVVGHRAYSRENLSTAASVRDFERIEVLRKRRDELKLELLRGSTT